MPPNTNINKDHQEVLTVVKSYLPYQTSTRIRQLIPQKNDLNYECQHLSCRFDNGYIRLGKCVQK